MISLFLLTVKQDNKNLFNHLAKQSQNSNNDPDKQITLQKMTNIIKEYGTKPTCRELSVEIKRAKGQLDKGRKFVTVKVKDLSESEKTDKPFYLQAELTVEDTRQIEIALKDQKNEIKKMNQEFKTYKYQD